MAEEGFGTLSVSVFAGGGGGLNAGMLEAASDEQRTQHDASAREKMKRLNDTKEDLHIFQPITKAHLDNDQLWVIGTRELGVGLPVYVPHKKLGACLVVRGTIKELWNEPGTRMPHFVVRRLHPMSVNRRNSDHKHYLVPMRCKKHGIDIPWILPVPIGLVNVQVSQRDKGKTRLTTIVWKNNAPTELTHASLEEAYQIMDGTLGEEKKEGMRALMEIQKRAYPELYARYLERSISLVERYGGSAQEAALDGGDGPSLLLQDRIGADPNAMSGALGELMPLALEEPTDETSNARVACMFILNHAPWLRTSFIKLYRLPDLVKILHKKHEVVRREERAVAMTKSWTVLNRPEVSEARRHAITQVFTDSFSTFGLDEKE